MNENNIPATAEALQGWGQVRGWERAALVYAWTEPQRGARTDLLQNRSKLSLAEFADIGIVGLTKWDTVANYRQQWADHGTDMDLVPGGPWPATWPTKKFRGTNGGTIQYSSPEGAAKMLETVATKNPEAFTKAVAESHVVQDAVTTAVAKDHKSTIEVKEKRQEMFSKPTVPPNHTPPLLTNTRLVEEIEQLLFELEDKWPEFTAAVREGGVHGAPEIIADWTGRMGIMCEMAQTTQETENQL